MNFTCRKTKTSGNLARRGFACIGSLSRYKFPSIAEITIAVLYLVAWLFPVIASWSVAVFGLRFSYVAPHRQSQNVDIVGICILIALASGIVAAVVVMTYLNKIPRSQRSNIWMGRLNSAQRFFLVVVLLIAAFGLFTSFGGTLFEKGYAGASVVWLGYGAWSVTFLLSLGLLVGDFLSTQSFRPAKVFVLVFVLPVVFVPFLLSGSRIDFLSFMLALVAYVLVLRDAKLRVRVLMSMAILAFVAVVATLIGNARYTVSDPALTFQATIPVKMIEAGVKDGSDMLYLSTIGDLGASVFQVVGLVQEHTERVVGIAPALLSYATRLLPGSFFTNRPGDFWTQLPESVGGGALHALGEGYLIFGLGGCALIGAVFGMLIAVSIFAGNHFRSTRTPLSWIIFAFPWLLLIRGGWYQFFALFKSIEILLLLLLLLMAVGRLGEKYSTVHCKGRVCR